MDEEHFDAIVVGSGFGGSVMSRRLAEGSEPTRESRNTQLTEFHFRALLTKDGARGIELATTYGKGWLGSTRAEVVRP
jgi:choline dehydrogenase-like flavoprotein